MNLKHLLLISAATLLLSQAAAQAQKLQFTLTGNCATLNSAGNQIGLPLNNQTVLADFAKVNGVASTQGMALVYHIKGNALGDTIDVINATNGVVFGTVFGLYFGEDPTLGRAGLASTDGTLTRRIEYIYTYQNSHSLGSALITTRYILDSSGHTNRALIHGPMQYIVMPDNFNPAVKVCLGTFITGAALPFP